ncbi:hypothetical protein HMSSN036_19910 [Paenibacillus macerans]|nr:hypothetical protein HMSSN036_19910 [Paenibacillus macerans]
MGTLLLDPIAFSIGALKVHWYGLILGSAALVGLLLAIREGKRFGISQEFFMDLLLLGVPSAIIGARIYFVAFMWEDYKDNLWDIFKIWNGGIAIYGALIGAIICAVIFVRRRGYNFGGSRHLRAFPDRGANDRTLGQLRQPGSLWRTDDGKLFAGPFASPVLYRQSDECGRDLSPSHVFV